MMIDNTKASIAATRIDSASSTQSKSIEKLATGKQINSASDDPAGLSMAVTLESQVRDLTRQIFNRQDEVSLMQTAEGGMESINDNIQRIHELSVQAANGTLTDDDRQAIQMEIDQLKADITQTSSNTEYNTKKLLNGSLNVTLQNGNNLSITNMSAGNLGIDTLDVTTTSGAEAGLSTAAQALSTVSSERSKVGALSNGLAAEITNLNQQVNNTLASQSRIADTDMAKEMLTLTLAKIQASAAVQVFRIQDSLRGNVLNLLGGV